MSAEQQPIEMAIPFEIADNRSRKFFLAILIARLVSLEIIHSRDRGRE